MLKGSGNRQASWLLSSSDTQLTVMWLADQVIPLRAMFFTSKGN